MIAKEEVVKLISELDNARNEKNAQAGKTGNILKNIAYSPEQKVLLEKLKALSKDELLDLYALFDYGRQLEHALSTPPVYSKVRKAIGESHITNDFIPQQLMSNVKTSTFLRNALVVYDKE